MPYSSTVMPVSGSMALGSSRYRDKSGLPHSSIRLPKMKPMASTVSRHTRTLRRTRLILPAPRFWLAKVSAAWWMAFIAV